MAVKYEWQKQISALSQDNETKTSSEFGFAFNYGYKCSSKLPPPPPFYLVQSLLAVFVTPSPCTFNFNRPASVKHVTPSNPARVAGATALGT